MRTFELLFTRMVKFRNLLADSVFVVPNVGTKCGELVQTGFKLYRLGYLLSIEFKELVREKHFINN